ncbi:winged helix-turn-helix domain-containing protein [Pseudoxanthomonas suwonensis]
MVSREQLLGRVWPDTLPTDDVLTQAVAQLRRAFGSGREAPPYIETIAKAGYRLLVPCTWIEPQPGAPAAVVHDAVRMPAAPSLAAAAVAAAPLPAPAPSPRPQRPRRWLLLPVLVLALALCAGAWQLLHSHAGAAAAPPAAHASALRYHAIASTALHEQHPSLSPDGGQVVYSRETRAGGPRALYLQAVADGSPRQLTFPTRDRPTTCRPGRATDAGSHSCAATPAAARCWWWRPAAAANARWVAARAGTSQPSTGPRMAAAW